MPNDRAPIDHLTPATEADLAASLLYALRFGRSGKRHGVTLTRTPGWEAGMTQRLVEHLRLSGYVVFRSPPAPAHTYANLTSPP